MTRRVGSGAFIVVVLVGAALFGVMKVREHEALLRDRRELREQKEYVQAAIERYRGLPDKERAEKLWALWIRIMHGDWPGPAGPHEVVLLPELTEVREAWMSVLLEEIRNANGEGGGEDEAPHYLSNMGPSAMHEVIDILKEGSAQAKWAALRSLWYFAVPDPGVEDRETIRQAVSPFLTDGSAQLRGKAKRILECLDEYDRRDLDNLAPSTGR